MAYRKTRATEARKDARRKTILDAATRLFGACGYHSTTVPMIVAESDSSVGSFYAHFRNKEDVFAAVLEALGQKVTEVMDQAGPPNQTRCWGFDALWSRYFCFWPTIREMRASSSSSLPA